MYIRSLLLIAVSILLSPDSYANNWCIENPAHPPCGGAPGICTKNSDGSLGGFVAATARVDLKEGLNVPYIGQYSQVCDSASVVGSARVYDHVRVLGSASVYHQARAYGEAEISGNAQIYGFAQVYGRARVGGTGVLVFGSAQIYENARVSSEGSEVLIMENAQVFGDTIIDGLPVRVPGFLDELFFKALGVPHHRFVEISGNVKLSGNNYIRSGTIKTDLDLKMILIGHDPRVSPPIPLPQPPEYSEDYVGFCAGKRQNCYRVLKSDILKYPNSYLAKLISGQESVRSYIETDEAYRRKITFYVLDSIDGEAFGEVLKWIQSGAFAYGLTADQKLDMLNIAFKFKIPNLVDELFCGRSEPGYLSQDVFVPGHPGSDDYEKRSFCVSRNAWVREGKIRTMITRAAAESACKYHDQRLLDHLEWHTLSNDIWVTKSNWENGQFGSKFLDYGLEWIWHGKGTGLTYKDVSGREEGKIVPDSSTPYYLSTGSMIYDLRRIAHWVYHPKKHVARIISPSGTDFYIHYAGIGNDSNIILMRGKDYLLGFRCTYWPKGVPSIVPTSWPPETFQYQ